MNKKSNHQLDINNPKSLFDHIIRLSNRHKYKDALNLIETNFDLLFAYDPTALLKLHLNILNEYQKLSYIDQALKLYQDKPYINIESEQRLKRLEQNKHISKNKPKYTYQEWVNDLASNQQSKIIKAINLTTLAMLKKGISNYQVLLNSPTLVMIRYMALIKLVHLKLPQSVTYENDGLQYDLIPSLLEPFDQTPFYQQFIKYVHSQNILNHQTEMIISLFNDYLMAIYPDSAIVEEAAILFDALFYLMNQYLNLDIQNVNKHTISIANEIERRLISFQSSD